MAVWMQCLYLGIYSYVGYNGRGTAYQESGSGFGCCLCVSSCRGISQRRWWQPGNHRSQTASCQTWCCTVQRRALFPLVNLLSSDGAAEKKKPFMFTQPNNIFGIHILTKCWCYFLIDNIFKGLTSFCFIERMI